MNEPPLLPRERRPLLRLILPGAAVLLMVLLLGALFRFLNSRRNAANGPVAPPAVAEPGPRFSEPQELAPTNVVTIRLGEDESGRGLVLIDRERDGRTTIESIDGVMARVLRLEEGRSEQYVYFRIDRAFKEEDVSRVRIDVEYLDPQPGTLSLHYDALDAPNVRNPAYRDATRAVRLAGSNVWQTASFYTRNDALFENRQNSGADFRLCARTPVLYLRRVTVTRGPAIDESWPVDFSTSNQVSILLGQENTADGLRHLTGIGDGQTVVTNLNGITCRYLNRLPEKKVRGSFYFEISPSFKRNGLTNARVEVEYLVPRPNAFRVEFDGVENGRNRSYVTVLPMGANVMRLGTSAIYARAPVVGAWALATFEITNATFQNSQNDGADFRFEVVPPEAYVRRVTVTRCNP